MGYSIELFKDSLQKSLAFTDIIKSNGYDFMGGNYQSFMFEKKLMKSNDGAEEMFTLSVHTQVSGFVSVKLSYRKKLKESSDELTLNQWLCCDEKTLNDRINMCEQKSLLVGDIF
jgi:hypothetical protein